MNKKLKNWLTLAVGIGIAGKAIYDMFDYEEEDDEVLQIQSKSKYANMEEIEEVKVLDEHKEEK